MTSWMRSRFAGGWRDVTVLAVLALIALALALMLYYGLLYDNPPAVFNNVPFPVEPQIVRAGDMLTVTSDLCRYTDVPVTIYRTWANDLSYLQSPEVFGGAPAGCGVNHFLVMVPAELPPGEYHIHYRFVYEVSPLSFPRVVEAHTEPFEVVR